MPEFAAMNTQFLTAGLSDADHDRTVALVKDAEIAYSRFHSGNILSIINDSENEWVSVDNRTLRLLTAAVEAGRQTEGLFNPLLGNRLTALGYNRSFETLADGVADSSGAPSAQAQDSIEIDETESKVRRSGVGRLDLGGFAKGWIAQEMADRLILERSPGGLIDAGGDVVVWGRDPARNPWGIGVAHPLQPESEIASLWFDRLAAIATSSVAKRRWTDTSGTVLHHIIDPRSGLPATSDLVQATVISRDLGTSEVLAKLLLILGSEAGIPWMASRRPDLAFIAVTEDGKVLTAGNLNCYCSEWEVSP